MSSLTTPRGAERTYRMSMDSYPTFHAGEYRGRRNVYLVLARSQAGSYRNNDKRYLQWVELAKAEHRNFLRCLREYRRELAMREAA